MSDLTIKEKILRAIESIPDDVYSGKIKPLNDPDIKCIIEEKVSKGVSIAKIYASISPDIVDISETHFRKWITDSGIIKKKKRRSASSRSRKDGGDGA